MERDEWTRITCVEEASPEAMWEEFTSARERFLALLAGQSSERRLGSADRDGSADRQQPREAEDVLVSQAHAAV